MNNPDNSRADAALQALYRDLAAAHLQPLWTITDQLLPPEPQPRAVPWLWPAATMKPLARRAISLVPVERGGERRVLSLHNPGLGGRPYAAGHALGCPPVPGPAGDRAGAPAYTGRDPLGAGGTGRLDHRQRGRLRHAPR